MIPRKKFKLKKDDKGYKYIKQRTRLDQSKSVQENLEEIRKANEYLEKHNMIILKKEIDIKYVIPWWLK